MNSDPKHPHQLPSSAKVRLDKWLWAARFFKTRTLAKNAIEGGKVHYNGAKSKVSKEVELGALLTIRQGFDEKEIEIIALAEQRRGAPEAQALYKETPNSETKRAAQADQRKVMRELGLIRTERPNKKQRRQIHRFKQDHQD